jgi:uncharacterized RDD family membrane protein YckC
MRVSSLQIRTPEGIVFSQVLAGPVSRLLAWSMDLMVIAALMSVVGYVAALLQVISPGLGAALSILSYFIINIGYGIACEWVWRGQTIGKKLFRLRVVDAEGLRLQFNQIATRNLLRFIDMLPFFYAAGGTLCWFHPKCQRLGDIAANTIVIRQPQVTEPDLDQLLAGKYNSLRQFPHLVARLRQRVSPGEAALALHALIRRDEFEPTARIELFASLASHFQAKAEFPAEATDGIADEQYLRNLADVLYRSRSESLRGTNL